MRLGEQLRTIAEQTPTYQVYDTTLRLAQRQRRRRIAILIATAALTIFVVMAGLPSVVSTLEAHLLTASSADDKPSLPDRIGLPYLGASRATDNPPGPASVMFGGDGWPFAITSDLAVVGASEDVYRTVDTDWLHIAGEDALLSPDGQTIALPGTVDDPPLRLVDLRTGKMSRLPVETPGHFGVVPVCWSPGSSRILVSVGFEDGQGQLAILDRNGHYAPLVHSVRVSSPRSFSAAFANDGRLAFIDNGNVHVLDRELNQLAAWNIDSDVARLAGKGAWSPDGTTIYEVRSTGSARWLLKPRNPITGAPADRSPRYVVENADLIRLIGWAADGRAIVVRYLADTNGTPGNVFHPWTYDWQRTNVVQLLSVSADGDTRVLMTAERGIDSIDVAAEVLRTGVVRKGHPPGVGPYTILFLSAVPLLLLLHVIRRTRWRRSMKNRAGADWKYSENS